MATLYELGKEMREPLTSEENQLVYEAQMLKKDPIAYQKESPTLWKQQLVEGSVLESKKISWELGALKVSDSEQAAHLKIAIQRAKRHFLPYGISPRLVGGSTPAAPPANHFPLENPRLMQGPLGISPEAIHCQVELDFTKREAQLKNALQLCSEPNALSVFFLNYGTSLKNQVKSDCYGIRTIEYAAMVCADEQASGMLEDLASEVAKESKAIQYMGELLTVMEKVVGIREGTLTQKEVDLCNRLIPGMSLTTTIATGSQVQRINPNPFNIEFVDFRHTLGTIPKSARDPAGKWLDEQLERYAATTVDIALTNLFGPTEVRKIGSEDHKVFADRASLVIVDGKTVYERIQERYRALQEKNLDMEPFAKWYPKNRNEMSAQIVAAGLMAGKHVEAYVPDPDGKLPDQPIPIQKTGYAPGILSSSSSKAAWEQYCRGLGFNEAEVDTDAEQRDLMDARKRVQRNYAALRTVELQPEGEAPDGSAAESKPPNATTKSSSIESKDSRSSSWDSEDAHSDGFQSTTTDTEIEQNVKKQQNSNQSGGNKKIDGEQHVEKENNIPQVPQSAQNTPAEEPNIQDVPPNSDIRIGSRVQPKESNQPNIESMRPEAPSPKTPPSQPVQHQIPKQLDIKFQKPKASQNHEIWNRYATTTVLPTLNTLFGPTEARQIGSQDHKVYADRASLIIVDGKTVYERIQERYRALQEKRTQEIAEWDKNQKKIANTRKQMHQWDAQKQELAKQQIAKLEAIPRPEEIPPFSEWYPKNRDEMSAQIVAAGLMAGKHVEAYVLGSDGKLLDKPIQIRNTGYAPGILSSSSSKAAWEQYCRGLGFNEAEVDTKAERRALMDARERLRAHHHVAYAGSKGGASKTMRDMFFRRYMNEHGLKSWDELSQLPTSTDYRLGRSAPVTTCICMMAALGHPLKDILDPTKLLEQKHMVAELYMDHALKQPDLLQREKTEDEQARDGHWLGSVLFHGQWALLKQLDAMMKDVNLKEPQKRKEMMPILYGAGSAMLDIDQEKDLTNAKAGYMATAERIYCAGTTSTDDTIKKDTKTLATEMVYQASDVAYFLDTLFKTDVARLSLASPYPEGSGKQIAYTLSLLPMEQCGLQRQTENAAKGMSFRLAVQDFCTITSIISQIAQDKAIIEASQQLGEQSKNWEGANGNSILAGFLDDEFCLDIDFNTGNVSIQRSGKSQNDLNKSKKAMSPRI